MVRAELRSCDYVEGEPGPGVWGVFDSSPMALAGGIHVLGGSVLGGRDLASGVAEPSAVGTQRVAHCFVRRTLFRK